MAGYCQLSDITQPYRHRATHVVHAKPTCDAQWLYMAITGAWTGAGWRVDHGGGVWNTHAVHAVTCTTEQVRAHIRNPFIYMLAGVTMPDLGSG